MGKARQKHYIVFVNRQRASLRTGYETSTLSMRNMTGSGGKETSGFRVGVHTGRTNYYPIMTFNSFIHNLKRFSSVAWIKSFIVAVYYLGVWRALQFPILFGHRVKVGTLGDRGALSVPKQFAALCFGLKGDPFNIGYRNSYWGVETGAKVTVKGTCRIAKGSVIHVFKNGRLEFGNNFSSNGNFTLSCADNICFGSNCMLGWDITIMDSDGGHAIIQLSDNSEVNKSSSIVIGNHVWIGASASILKGSQIGDGCIIGFKSNVCGLNCPAYSIIAGNPASIIKSGYSWLA